MAQSEIRVQITVLTRMEGALPALLRLGELVLKAPFNEDFGEIWRDANAPRPLIMKEDDRVSFWDNVQM